jgi:hypothetical protein
MEYEKSCRDPVIAAALEYESATLDALATLDGTDGDAQIIACLRFVDAMPLRRVSASMRNWGYARVA